jgi:hypothetical protein
MKRAIQLLASAQFDNNPRSMVTDLIYLQAYILLAIAANNTPASILRSQHTIPNSALSNAVNLAYTMKLHRNMPQAQGDDVDSDDRVARRLWWAVVSLDRWNAASTDRPSMIPEYSIVLHPEDQAILGDVPYQLTRKILSSKHIAHTDLIRSIYRPGSCCSCPRSMLRDTAFGYQPYSSYWDIASRRAGTIT